MSDLQTDGINFNNNNIKKYVIANYTSLQPTRNEILKLK